MGTKTSGLKLKRGGLLKLVDRETDRCTEGLFIGADENGNFVVVPLSEKRFHPSAGSVLHGQCRVKDDMVAFSSEILEVLDRPVTMWRIHEPAEVKKYDLRAKTRIHCSISATIEALNQGQVLTGIVRDISKSGARCIFQLSDAAGNPLERDDTRHPALRVSRHSRRADRPGSSYGHSSGRRRMVDRNPLFRIRLVGASLPLTPRHTPLFFPVRPLSAYPLPADTGRQGVVQIIDDILNILDAHTESNEIRGDAGGLLFGLAELLVGRGGRVNHQALGVPDVGQMAEQLQIFDEFHGCNLPPPDTEAHQRTLSFGKVLVYQAVGRRRFQAGVADPGDAVVPFQVAGHGHSVFRVALHSQVQGFQPLQEHPGVEGAHGGAHVPQAQHPRPQDKGQAAEGFHEFQPVV